MLWEREQWCLFLASGLCQGLKVQAGRSAQAVPALCSPLGAAAAPGGFSEGNTEAAASLCWEVTVPLEKMLLPIAPQTRWDISLQCILEYFVDTKQQLESSFGINSFPTAVVAGRILLKL